MNYELEEKYKKESGYDVGRYNIDNTNYYSEDYVEWLEKQLLLHNVSQQRELLVAFLEMLENTPRVEIPLQVGLVAVDEYLETNCG